MRLLRPIAVALAAVMLLGSCSGVGGGDDGIEVIAYYTDVGDLVTGATVQALDVEIGLVRNIDLVYEDGQMLAKVTMNVDPAVDIPATQLKSVIRQTSLLGEQFVELVPGSEGAPYLEAAGTTIEVAQTERRVDIETFLSDLSGFIGNGALEDLNRFTHAQALILEDRGRRLGQTIGELERFTAVLADRRFDIGAAIDSLAGASETLATNRATLDSFLDSLERANVLLADQGDELRTLFTSLRRFGTVSSRFLARHESAINRQFQALRPVFRAIASAEGELRVDITQLATFFELFPKSMGGGPGGNQDGDYIQVDAVLCEMLSKCHTKGERGDVPGEGS